MTLTEKIQTALIGSKYSGILETGKILSDILGEQVYFYDSVIDYGVDVMRDCFANTSYSITIRVYYGDVTREI